MKPKPNYARLIRVVEAKLLGLPDIDHNNLLGSHDRRRAAVRRALDELHEQEGAKWEERWDGCRLSMAGIKTSSTTGGAGAMHNWVKAAGKRITAEFFA